MAERLENIPFGVDIYVCDRCKAIIAKPAWMMNKNTCPECGNDSKELRGKFYDRKIYIDGYMAQADGGLWADWAKDGFLVGEPAPGLEKSVQR
jgi:hypothetical protein